MDGFNAEKREIPRDGFFSARPKPSAHALKYLSLRTDTLCPLSQTVMLKQAIMSMN